VAINIFPKLKIPSINFNASTAAAPTPGAPADSAKAAVPVDARADAKPADPNEQWIHPEGEKLLHPYESSTFNGKLKDANFFKEKQTAFVADPYGLGVTATPSATLAPNSQFFSGQSGRLLAARFIGPEGRTDGDFRYAYGKQEFQAWMKADETLQDIPQGKLADNLNIDLLKNLNKLSFVPDKNSVEGMVEYLGRTIRRGRPPEGGQFRTDALTSNPQHFTHDQEQHLSDNGLSVKSLKVGADNDYGVIVYKPADQVQENVQKLIDDTKAGLADPKSDPYELAANFITGFISAHPFEDGNGRVARLVSDRILAERGLPAPILANPDDDVVNDKQVIAASLKVGVARTQSFLSTGRQRGLSSYASKMFSVTGQQLPKLDGPDKLVRVDGMPYAQGRDGLVYDAGGRPYRADDQGTLQPMSQMEYHLDMRRIAMQPDAAKTLTDFSQKTRDVFAGLAAKDGVTAPGDKPPIGDDQAMMAADNKFQVNLSPGSHQDLVKLYDPKAVKADTLFKSAGGAMSADSTLATTAMSRYDQLDLEMWHMQQAMDRCGDADGVKGMQQNRAALFDAAKGFLKENPSTKPPKVEALKLSTSPLRFNSFDEATKSIDDDKIMLWRGDLAAAKLMGVQADYIPLRADAKDDGATRESKGGTGSLIDQLNSLSGSAIGTGFMSFTSDPTLLADTGFASKTTSTLIDMAKLAKPVQAIVNAKLSQPGSTLEIDSLSDLLGAGIGTHRVLPPGSLDIGSDSHLDANLLKQVDSDYMLPDDTKKAIKDRITDCRKQSDSSQGFFSHSTSTVLNLSDLVKDPSAVQSLQDGAASQRAMMSVRREGKDQVQVNFYRKAFVAEVNKADCIPGINALGGGFEMEQEIHVDHKQAPTAIVKQYASSDLQEDKPAVPGEGLGFGGLGMGGFGGGFGSFGSAMGAGTGSTGLADPPSWPGFQPLDQSNPLAASSPMDWGSFGGNNLSNADAPNAAAAKLQVSDTAGAQSPSGSAPASIVDLGAGLPAADTKEAQMLQSYYTSPDGAHMPDLAGQDFNDFYTPNFGTPGGSVAASPAVPVTPVTSGAPVIPATPVAPNPVLAATPASH
jgi:prophage maintenance system killer protein